MEIDKTCCLLKNVFTSIEKRLSLKLVDINASKSGVKNIITSIISELKSNNFFENKNDGELRELHLLLLINTDTSIINELECDRNIGYAVGSVPRLSPYLYIIIITKFNLIAFIVEIIEHGPLKLVIELLDLIVDNIESLRPYDLFEANEAILSAIYYKLRCSNCNYTVTKLNEYFEILMLHYDPNYDEDIKEKIKMKRTGYSFFSLVKLMHKVSRITCDKTSSNSVVVLPEIDIHVNVTEWYNESELMNKEDAMNKCCKIVFSKCQLFMQNLDLNMYMYWHEIDYAIDKSLQVAIGEEVFRVCKLFEKYKNLLCLPKDAAVLSSLLKEIAKESAEEKDKIEEEYTVQQLEELITETADFDLSFLKNVESILAKHNNRFTYEITVQFIHKLCCSKIKDDTATKDFVLSLLKKLNTRELFKCLEDFVFNYGINNILCKPTVDLLPVLERLYQVNDENEIDSTKFEEYSIVEEEVLKKIALFNFQSPCYVIKTLIKEGARENKSKIIVKLLEDFKSIYSFVPDANSISNNRSLLISVMEEFLHVDFQELSVIEKHSFIDFVITLHKQNLVGSDEILIYCVFPLLYVEKNINWETMTNLIKLAKDFYIVCDKKVTFNLTTVLVQMAQILEQSRWSITTFSFKRIMVCEEIIAFINVLLHSYAGAANYTMLNEIIKGTDHELEWLKEMLDNFSSITKSYFSSVFPYVESHNLELKLLSLIHNSTNEDFLENVETQNILVLYMSKIITICTPKELQNIVQNYSKDNYRRIYLIFNLISDSIAFISNTAYQFTILQHAGVSSVFNCLGHIVNNYLELLQANNVFCGFSSDDVNFIKFINRISAVLKIFPENMKQTYQFNVIKFISEMLPKLKDTSNDFDGDTRQLLVGLILI